MKSLQIDISDANKLPENARQLLNFAGELKVFAFEAEMGAGKTTFLKALCKALGSKDNFSSPTYSIVNEYLTPTKKLYHFVLYRLKSAEELLDIGFEEYVDSKRYCFIEWPELALSFLPKPYVSVAINPAGMALYRASSLAITLSLDIGVDRSATLRGCKPKQHG